jgi:DNA-binding NtrC family response regulator
MLSKAEASWLITSTTCARAPFAGNVPPSSTSNGASMVVFSDIDMPGAMDGLALYARISRHRADAKVLLTSGVDWPVKARAGGNFRFLAKPS